MDIDWSKAPEGATHYRAPGGVYYGGFYRLDESGDWFFYVDSSWEFMGAPDKSESHPLASRPTKPAAPEWVDGLPKAGDKIEVDDYRYGWIEGEVIGIDKSEMVIVCRTDCGYSGYSVYREIRTADQRQREELQSLLEEHLDWSHSKAMSNKAVDAIIKFYEERFHLEPKP